MLFKDFNKFKFNVIDITSAAQPEMTVNFNGVSFNQACLTALNSPAFVQILLDTDNKVLAIKVCKENEPNCIDFGEKSYKSGITTNCKAIRSCIRNNMTGIWADDKRYKMTGVVFAANKAIVFDLASATELFPMPSTGKKRAKSI